MNLQDYYYYHICGDKDKRTKYVFSKYIKMLKEFVPDGGTVFDLGANVGNMGQIFLDLGASIVVMVEPGSKCFKTLKERFGTDPRVVLYNRAISDSNFKLVNLYVEPDNPTTHPDLNLPATRSTTVKEVYDQQKINIGIEHWPIESVKTITMKKLIETCGTPDFVKIDVEGAEYTALKTLYFPLKALSFETRMQDIETGVKCVGFLEDTWDYEFNYSIDGTAAWGIKKWVGPEEIRNLLVTFDKNLVYSQHVEAIDVYARRIE